MMTVAIAVKSSLCPGQAKRMMREPAAQIGNPGSLTTVSRNNRFVQTRETEDASPTPKGLV